MPLTHNIEFLAGDRALESLPEAGDLVDVKCHSHYPRLPRLTVVALGGDRSDQQRIQQRLVEGRLPLVPDNLQRFARFRHMSHHPVKDRRVNRGFRNPRLLVGGAMAATLAAVVAGFWLDAKGFAGNALAELAGMIASILVALLIVERLVAANQRRRWREVADGTLRTLENAIVQAALDVYLLLPAPRPPAADPFTMSQADHLADGLAMLSAAVARESSVGEDPPHVVQLLGPAVRTISEVIIPRLLQINGEPDLVRPLVDIERAMQTLDYDGRLFTRFGLPQGAFAEDLAVFINALGAAAAAMEAARTRLPDVTNVAPA